MHLNFGCARLAAAAVLMARVGRMMRDQCNSFLQDLLQCVLCISAAVQAPVGRYTCWFCSQGWVTALHCLQKTDPYQLWMKRNLMPPLDRARCPCWS